MRVDSVRAWEWGRENLVQSKRRRSWEGKEEGISHKLPPGAPSIPFRSESVLGSISPLGSKQSRCYCGVEEAHIQTGTSVARTLQKTTFVQKEVLHWFYCIKHIICQLHTRVGTLIVATIYLKLIQNRYMFRSFTVLHCSHQHCVQPVASDVEAVGYL